MAKFQLLAKAYVKLCAKQKQTLGLDNKAATLVSSVLKESYASCVDDIFSSGLERGRGVYRGTGREGERERERMTGRGVCGGREGEGERETDREKCVCVCMCG